MEERSRRPFGTMPDGTQVEEITLRSGGLTAGILTYGGAVRTLTVPGRSGAAVDVALGFDSLEDYRRQDKYLGALVGRVANRIGGARFSLGGREYPLAANNGENHIHGGLAGFDRQVWQVEEAGADRLVLSLFSPDGQEGYPGDLSVRVAYTLSPEGLSIAYWARSSRDTLCNLTNHSYFNLNGHASGPVAGQYIQINAGRYTPADGGSIPTGELAPVEGTPMDLRAGVRIGARIDEDFPQLTMAGGYDHNWVVDGPGLVGGDGDRSGGEHHHARRTILHRQLSGRLSRGEGERPLRQAVGLLPGDPVLPGRRPPSGVPQPGAAGRGGVPAGDPVLLLRGQMSGCGPEAYCLRPAFLFVRFRGSASSPGCSVPRCAAAADPVPPGPGRPGR